MSVRRAISARHREGDENEDQFHLDALAELLVQEPPFEMPMRLSAVTVKDYMVEMMEKYRPLQRPFRTTLENVTVSVTQAPGQVSQPTLVGTFINPLFRMAKVMVGWEPIAVKRSLIKDITLAFLPGEMTLLLGSPQCGVSTLLSVLSARSLPYTGEVKFNGMKPLKDFWIRDVSYVPEEDIHLALLTVLETVDFAARFQMPYAVGEEIIQEWRDMVLKLLGIYHRKDNIVGDDLVRGISGGERKRLTVAVGLLRFASLYLIDEPTTGLDAGTALRLIRVLRGFCDAGPPVVIAARQPSMEILSQFDRIVILSHGRVAFSGTIDDGFRHFRGLGYVCPRDVNPSEFFQEVVEHPHKYAVDKSHLHSIDEFVGLYEASMYYAIEKEAIRYAHRPRKSAEQYLADKIDNGLQISDGGKEKPWKRAPHALQMPKRFGVEVVGEEEGGEEEGGEEPPANGWNEWVKKIPVGKWVTWGLNATHIHDFTPHAYAWESSYPSRFLTQIALNFKRGATLLYRDKMTVITKVFVAMFISLLLGFTFFQQGNDQIGVQNRIGFIYFVMLYFGLEASGEIEKMVLERAVFYQQSAGKNYAPLPYLIGTILKDMPSLLIEVMIFSVFGYWLTGLTGADNGWRYVFFILITILISEVNTSQVRFISILCTNASLGTAVSTIWVLIQVMFSGFMIKYDDIPYWYVPLYWANPMTYAYVAAVNNELYDQTIACKESQLLPPPQHPDFNRLFPEGYEGKQACQYETGKEYMEFYDVPTDEMVKWSYVIALVVWFIMSVFVTYLALAFVRYRGSRVTDREPEPYFAPLKIVLRYVAGVLRLSSWSLGKDDKGEESKAEVEVVTNGATMEWKDVRYFVRKYKYGFIPYKIEILNYCFGYVKPGMMLALVGQTGAGKSSLLDVLAQRKNAGTFKGQILLNGEKIPYNYHRYMGYVEQRDNHIAGQTIEEAVRFAALTRMSGGKIRLKLRDKLKHAKQVLKQVGLYDIRHHRVGHGDGDGINVETRKRLTLAVELAAKPRILFLDEPTSGLDSAGAERVMETTEQIYQMGIPVICTIHQPSKVIFSKFTHVLMLMPGGYVAYFGRLHNRQEDKDFGALLSYLREYVGVECPKDSNPADVLLQIEQEKYRVPDFVPPQDREDVDALKQSLDMSAGVSALRQSDVRKSSMLTRKSYEVDEHGEEVKDIGFDVSGLALALTFKATEMYEKIARRIAYGVHQRRKEKEGTEDDFFNKYSIWGRYAIPTWLMLTYLIRREYSQLYRVPAILRDRIVMALLFSVVLGTVYLQLPENYDGALNRVKVIFMATIFPYLSAMSLAPELVAVRPSIYRELASGSYSYFAYAVSSITWDLPIEFSVTLVFSVIIYLLVGFQIELSRFLYFTFIMCLATFSGYAMSRMAAFLASSAAVALLIVNLMITGMMLYAGFYLPRGDIPAFFLPIHWGSMLTHMLESLVYNELDGLGMGCANGVGEIIVHVGPGKFKGFCPFRKGNDFLQLLDFNERSYWLAPLVLSAWYVIFTFIACLAFRFIKHLKR